MSELQQDIMEHVGKVIHDYYDKHWPDSRGGYGDNVHANAMYDSIEEKIARLCSETEDRYCQLKDDMDSLEDNAEDVENERDEAVSEMEDMQFAAERAAMIKQFWYYAGRTKVNLLSKKGGQQPCDIK